MILAMATKRTIDDTRCHAWIYEDGRQCRIRKPRDKAENKAWYCQSHSMLKRAKLWLRYKWKHTVLWKKLLLAPVLFLGAFAASHGMDLYSFIHERKASHETDMKLNAVLEHFSEQTVRAYLDDEYPLGYILYEIHKDEITPSLKNLGPRLEVLFKNPYLTREGGLSYINLNVEFPGIAVKFTDTHLPIPQAKKVRVAGIWAAEYGLLSEFIEEKDETSFVCVALSSDQKLFPGLRRGLEFITRDCITGTCSLDRQYVGMIITGTLVNTSGDSLDLREIYLVRNSGPRTLVFRPVKFEGADGAFEDAGQFTVDPARNLAVKGVTLSSNAKEKGYLALVTTDVTLQQLRQLLRTEGMAVHLESIDSHHRREVWSKDFHLGEAKQKIEH
jgi:hypothetical protein